jgi:hypothetical protein
MVFGRISAYFKKRRIESNKRKQEKQRQERRNLKIKKLMEPRWWDTKRENELQAMNNVSLFKLNNNHFKKINQKRKILNNRISRNDRTVHRTEKIKDRLQKELNKGPTQSVQNFNKALGNYLVDHKKNMNTLSLPGTNNFNFENWPYILESLKNKFRQNKSTNRLIYSNNGGKTWRVLNSTNPKNKQLKNNLNSRVKEGRSHESRFH